MSITDKSKIVIIGAGNVGEAVCYTLMVRRQASEIVLVDINGDRAEGAPWILSTVPPFFTR